MTAVILGIVVLGGIYVATRSNESDKMMSDKKMEADKMAADTMAADKKMEAEKMAKDEAMMKKDDSMVKKDDAMMAKEDGAMMMKGGQYIAYDASKLAFAKEGKVVLFFKASWCPKCQAVDADINASLKDIPANTLILTVDYDASKDLKIKYGVTTQHTFVQVDAEGNSINKWIGSETLEKVLSNVK